MAEIPSTPADGNVRVQFVSTIASLATPAAADLNAVGGQDLSCYITGGGLAVSLDEASVPDERLCSTQVFEQPGRKTHSLELTYIDNTNSANEATDNKAVDTLTEGTAGYIVIRRGTAFGADFASTEKVRIYPVKAGAQRPNPPEANSVLTTTQKLFITSDVVDGVVAGA